MEKRDTTKKIGVTKVENEWKQTTTDVEAYDWKGKPIYIKRVPALQNIKTGKIRVEASEVAKAEMQMIAQEHCLESRDVALLLMLYAKPGLFKEGEVHYKYHLNKMLFYQWMNTEKEFGDSLPHDSFRAADKGPIPVNLWDDLKRFEKHGLIELKFDRWGKTKAEASLKTILTQSGLKLADELWKKVDPEIRKITLETKEEIFPLDPETVMKKVHKEFPEYKKTYVEPDLE